MQLRHNRLKRSRAPVAGTASRRTCVLRWRQGVVAMALLGLLVACSKSPPPSIQSGVVNGHFEATPTSAWSRPPGWTEVGSGGSLQLVEAPGPDRGHSLQMQRAANAEFVGISQAIDAAPWRGKVIELRARFKSAGLGPGANGLWLNVLDPAAGDAFDHTYDELIAPDSGWVERRIVVEVSPTANAVVLGAAAGGAGILWVDDIALQEHAVPANASMTAEARQYIDTAIDLLERRSLRSPTVDWASARQMAHAIAANARSTRDTYPAVRAVVRRLRDGHSSFLSPIERAALAHPATSRQFAIASELLSGYGYVLVPGFTSADADTRKAFADDLNERIRKLQNAGACGWIVDLRRNTGGAIDPMLAGLAGLLPDGTLGYFVENATSSTWGLRNRAMYRSDDSAATGERATSPVAALYVDGGPVPVAVLTGNQTASAGEAIALAFEGRANARRFGQRTRGLSTGVTTQTLSDGAMLAITASAFADRSGRRYGGDLVPDETVAAPSPGSSAATDPVIESATRWLKTQTQCGKR